MTVVRLVSHFMFAVTSESYDESVSGFISEILTTTEGH